MPSTTSKVSNDIRALLILLLAGIVLAIPFLLYPRLDIEISQRIFSTEIGGFIYVNHIGVLAIYRLVPMISTVTVLTAAGIIAATLLKPHLRFIPKIFVVKDVKIPVFLLACLLIGPGAAVHWVPKEIFERPRPREITEFGGKKQYVPPFHIGKEDGKSFVSGHASVGFFFASLALIAKRRKRELYIGGIAAGLIVGAGRVLQGGHYVSDVIFAGVLILMINHLLHWLMFRKRG